MSYGKIFRSFKSEWMLQLFMKIKNAVINYIAGYYSKLKPHSYNRGLTLNESERRYWKTYKLMANIT